MPLTPVVMVGAVMTISIFGAIVGIPILVLTARPWWTGVAVGLSRRTAADVSAAEQVWIGVCVSTGIATSVVCAALGLNDLDTAFDGLAWLVFASMLGASMAGAVGLVRGASQQGTH